jgi:hypothetical protein
VITTPENGTATLRIFNCGRLMGKVKTLIRRRLSGRLVGADLRDQRDSKSLAFTWLTRGGINATKFATAVRAHGPLLIAVTSKNIQLEDLEVVAKEVRMSLPVPTIPGCFPICIGFKDKRNPCKAETSEDEG